MTGEMSRDDVTEEAYPLHFAIAKEFKGEVRPFDVYQGPYVLADKGKFWISSENGEECYIYNERTDKRSEPFWPHWKDQGAANEIAVAAAYETL